MFNAIYGISFYKITRVVLVIELVMVKGWFLY